MGEGSIMTTWTDKEVQALISIWGNSKIQEQLVQWETKPSMLRYKKTCMSKIKNLKAEYRKVKD